MLNVRQCCLQSASCEHANLGIHPIIPIIIHSGGAHAAPLCLAWVLRLVWCGKAEINGDQHATMGSFGAFTGRRRLVPITSSIAAFQSCKEKNLVALSRASLQQLSVLQHRKAARCFEFGSEDVPAGAKLSAAYKSDIARPA
jgi:hypothetical protein